MINRLTRRRLLALGVPAVAVLALAGCPSFFGSSPDAATQKIQTIAAGLSGLATALSAIPGVPPDVLAKVQDEIAAIQAQAATLGGIVSAPSTDVISAISNSLGIIATLATPFFPAAPAVAAGIQAAISVISSLLQTFGLARNARFAAVAPMDEAKAEELLRFYAAHGMH